MSKDQFDAVGTRTAQIAGFGVQRPAVVAGAGLLPVGEEGAAEVAEPDFLDIAEGLDGRVFTPAVSAPNAEQWSERSDVRMWSNGGLGFDHGEQTKPVLRIALVDSPKLRDAKVSLTLAPECVCWKGTVKLNGRWNELRRSRRGNCLLRASALGLTLLLAAACSDSRPDETPALDGNNYVQTNLAANDAEYKAQFTFPDLVNAWGLANRPKGAGGHFWVGAGGKSFQFVGDVTESSDAQVQKLFQDGLKIVTIPGADADTSDASAGKTTGVVFNPAPITSDLFYVHDQPVEAEGGPLNGSARFIVATDSGKISAWTELDFEDRIVRHDGPANLVFDGQPQGMQFLGIALTPSGDKLLAADFGAEPQVRTFDKDWQLVPTTGFANPFATGDAIDPAAPEKGRKAEPGDPAPFNVSTVGNRVFVAYATTKADRADATAFDAGEEDSLDKDQEQAAGGRPDKGKLAEFDADGKLVRILGDGKRLNAPWAVTVAPEGFGPLSGKLLVGNFGGAGHVLAYDDATGKFADYLRDADGKPVAIEGLWALMFGNGDSLGDADSLYFTAGPGDEKDGLFGRLRLK